MGFCMYSACVILVECRFLRRTLGRLSSLHGSRTLPQSEKIFQAATPTPAANPMAALLGGTLTHDFVGLW